MWSFLGFWGLGFMFEHKGVGLGLKWCILFVFPPVKTLGFCYVIMLRNGAGSGDEKSQIGNLRQQKLSIRFVSAPPSDDLRP